MQVNAAVVSSFDHPPRWELFDLPAPADEDQEVVDVLAVGLHPRVRNGASGKHYTSTGKLPLVPGIDGVGRRADGRMVYFVATTTWSVRWRPGPSSTAAAACRCPTVRTW
jgi:hypothetical protein